MRPPCNQRTVNSVDSRERNVKFGAHSAIANDLGERLFFAIDDNNSKNARLEIKNVQDADGGMYRCRVDFFNSATRNSRINLTLVGMYASTLFSPTPSILRTMLFQINFSFLYFFARLHFYSFNFSISATIWWTRWIERERESCVRMNRVKLTIHWRLQTPMDSSLPFVPLFCWCCFWIDNVAMFSTHTQSIRRRFGTPNIICKFDWHGVHVCVCVRCYSMLFFCSFVRMELTQNYQQTVTIFISFPTVVTGGTFEREPTHSQIGKWCFTYGKRSAHIAQHTAHSHSHTDICHLTGNLICAE